MKNTYDLIIVGSGALGTFHAYHALRKGLSVLMIEKDSKPVQATVRNFGQVVPSGQQETWWEYGKLGLAIYKDIQQKTDITVRENGSVYVASDEGEMQLLREMHDLYKQRGYQSQLLDQSQCLDRVDRLRATYAQGALTFPQELTVEPRKMIYCVIDYLKHDYQLAYLTNTPVIEVAIENRKCKVVTSNFEKFTSEKVIVCNGSEFRTLFPDIFKTSGIKYCKLQMMRTHPMPTVKLKGAILTGLTIRRYEAFHACPSYKEICTQASKPELAKYGIHILFKQGVDHSIIIGDSHEYSEVTDTESLDFGVSTYINQLMIEEARQILDLPSWEMETHWAGFYGAFENSIFEYEMENKIYITTGIGGKGMTTAAGYSQQHIAKIYG